MSGVVKKSEDEEETNMTARLETMWIGVLYGIQKWTRRKLARAYGRYTRHVLRRQCRREATWMN